MTLENPPAMKVEAPNASSGNSVVRQSTPALRKLLKEVDVANKRIELYADVLAEVGLFED